MKGCSPQNVAVPLSSLWPSFTSDERFELHKGVSFHLSFDYRHSISLRISETVSSLLTPLFLCDLHQGPNFHLLSRKLEISKSLYDLCICLVNIWNIQQHRLLGCSRPFHSSMNLGSLWAENVDAHASLFCAHRHPHTRRYKLVFEAYSSLLSYWTEKFWEGISPPALLHWGGSSDLPLPLWSGNYAVMAPSWCQHRTLCSLLSTWLSALLLVFLFPLLSWNSICLPSWLKDIFLPFPSSNQSKSEKMSFFCCC